MGDTFQMTLPEDLISSRPTAEKVEPYGLAYVFFAACAGTVRPAEPGPDGIPLGCFDAQGNRLGSDDFVPGYFALYSYENRSNTNPVILGLTLDGTPLGEDEQRHIPQSKLKLDVQVDQASVEIDPSSLDADGDPLTELLWVNYYTTSGDLSSSARLVNEPTKGWNTDTDIDFEPDAAGKVVLYAVVHDSRGGIAWIRREVVVD